MFLQTYCNLDNLEIYIGFINRRKGINILNNNINNNRESLEKKFDLVQLLSSTEDLSFEESAKIFAHEVRIFARGIFLSSSILVR